MNSNVFKFLVKSILSTAFAATVTSGLINGMDQQQANGDCIICSEPLGTNGGIATLHNDPQPPIGNTNSVRRV